MVDPPEVSTSYSYIYCFQRTVTEVQCTTFGTRVMEVAPLVPPFSYNNLCTSMILTSYIPVFIFIYAVHILLPIVSMVVFASVDTPVRFPAFVRIVTQGVFWPDYWQCGDGHNEAIKCTESGSISTIEENADSKSHPKPIELLKADRIISSDILSHMLIFFTFGLCSPLLSAAIFVAASLKHQMWIILLGRFVDKRLKANARVQAGGKDFALSALSEACVPVLEKVTHCVWPVIWTSALFFAFLGWDILGDYLAWRVSVWAPIVTLCVPACLWIFTFARSRQRKRSYMYKTRTASEANMIAMGRFSLSANNPLQHDDGSGVEA